MTRLALHWQIAIAMVLACLAGWIGGRDAALFGIAFYDVYDFLGALFLNALKMLVVPLVMASIITGIGGMGSGEDFGRMGIKTLAYYGASSLIAILTGLMLVNLLEPGIVDGQPAGDQLNLRGDTAQLGAVLEQVEGAGGSDLVQLFLRMIPANVVEAAADGQMLGLIFFSLLFGFYMIRITPEYGQVLRGFWQGVFEVMMKITMGVMVFAPLGVFGLVAKTVAATGFAAVGPLLVFFVCVALGLAVHSLLTLSAALWVLGGVRPFAHLRAMAPALLTAFSTASSSATLPMTIERIEKGSGVSNRTSGFVLPLGATINMDGTALYECAAAVFIAQAYGLDLSFAQQLLVVLVALLTSIGVAGIPAASLVAISVILGAIGLPLEGIGLLLVTDRILDMIRTAVNVYSDSCGAVIIARSEGETTAIARK